MKKIKLLSSIFMAVLLIAFSFPVGVYAEDSEIAETPESVADVEQETKNTIISEDETYDEETVEEDAVIGESIDDDLSDDASEDSGEDEEVDVIPEENETLYSDEFFFDSQMDGIDGVLKAVERPYITDISLSKSQVKITFSQYMKPETVKNIVLKNENGVSVGYTLEYPKDEKDSEEAVIAKEFTFVLKSENVIFSISVPTSIKNCEGTSVAAGMNVKGVIKSYNPKIKTTISLVKNGEVFSTCTIEATDGWGEVTQKFVFGGVPSGKYDLVVTKDCHVSYTIKNVVIKNEDVVLSQYERDYQTMCMLVGDINGDTNINATDWSILWNEKNYMKSTEDAAEKLADINGDGNVNATDWSILWNEKNYMKGLNSSTFEYVAPPSYETEIDPFF